MREVREMPCDWDKHEEWEDYYRSLFVDTAEYQHRTTDSGSFSVDRLGSLIDDLVDKNWLTIWFPGCGLSPLPRIFSEFGFTVHATDVSSTAVEYQRSNRDNVSPLLEKIDTSQPIVSESHLTSKQHDFRNAYVENVVDVIFNVKSFQALSTDSMHQAAVSHYAALRSGRQAFFDTMNVQGGRRDLLEDTLVSVGFYIPLHELNKWYRQALANTNIPHAFILGSPMIPQTDEYPHERGSDEYKRDQDILRNITKEYRSRIESEYEEEQRSVGEQTKHASIIYSTG